MAWKTLVAFLVALAIFGCSGGSDTTATGAATQQDVKPNAEGPAGTTPANPSGAANPESAGG